MINIESVYAGYEKLVERIGAEKIQDRYQTVYEEVCRFIQVFDRDGAKLFINERALMHVVLEYFADIEKVKTAHGLEHTNSVKINAYFSYWFLRRHPIQIRTDAPEDDDLVFINEKYILSSLMAYLTLGSEAKPLTGEEVDLYKAFTNTFYYYLKFRKTDPQALEMILLSFRLGGVFPECRNTP